VYEGAGNELNEDEAYPVYAIQNARNRLKMIRQLNNWGAELIRLGHHFRVRDARFVPISLFRGNGWYNFQHIPAGRQFQNELDSQLRPRFELRVQLAILSGKYFPDIPPDGKITVGECGSGAHKGDHPVQAIRFNVPLINYGSGVTPAYGSQWTVAGQSLATSLVNDAEYEFQILTPFSFTFSGVTQTMSASLVLNLAASDDPVSSELRWLSPTSGFTETRPASIFTTKTGQSGSDTWCVELANLNFIPDAVMRVTTMENLASVGHPLPRLRFQSEYPFLTLGIVCTSAVAFTSFVLLAGAAQLVRLHPTDVAVVGTPTVALAPGSTVAVSSLPATTLNVSVQDLPLPVHVTGSLGTLDVSVTDVRPTVIPLWISDTRVPPLPEESKAEHGFDAVEQAARNRMMHASHGNGNEDHKQETWAGDASDDEKGVVMPTFYDPPEAEVLVPLDAKLLETAISDFRLDELHGSVLRFVFDCPLPLSNAYDALENDASDMVSGSAVATLATTLPVGPGPQRPPKGGATPLAPKPQPSAAQPILAPDLPHNMVTQRLAALDRIVAAIRKGKLDFFTWLLRRRPDRDWAIAVCARAWGKGWDAVDLERKAVSMWLAYPSELERRDWIARYMMDDNRIQRVVTEALGGALTTVSPGWFNSARVFKTEADAHNAAMHAYNGNPVSVATMADVKALPTYDSFTEDSKTDERFDGQLAAMKISLQTADTNPTDSSVAAQSVVRAATQTPNGLLTQRVTFEPLETTMYPRRVADVAPNFINSPYRTQWTRFVGMAVLGQPLEATPLWKKLGGELLRDGFQMGRNDTLAPNGFKQWDVLTLGQMTAPNGFDMSQPILKLKLWHKILTWGTTSAVFLPTCNDVSKFDPPVRGSNIDNGGLAINIADPMGYGEGLGGATSIYPFEGGASGTVTFHVCLDTVPLDHRANLAVFPRAFIRVLGDTGKEYAVMIGSMIKWPFLWYNVLRRVANGPIGAFVNHSYTPHALTTYVDGFLDLHVLLPRTGSGLNPTTQAAANLACIRPPRSGPDASTAIAADADLNVAYFGGAGPFSVPVCEYMYTWRHAITSEDIRVYLMALYRLADVTAFINMADERVAMCAVRYAPMVTAAAPAHCDNGQTQILPDGRTLQAEVAAFPLTVLPDAGFLIPEFDVIAWNHLAMGTRTAPNYPPSNPVSSPMLTKPQNVYWTTLQARTFAITRHLILASTRLSAQTWDNSFAVGVNHEMRDYVNDFYWGGAMGQGFKSAPNGALCAAMYKKAHGTALWMDQFKNTVYDYLTRPTTSFTTIHNGVQGGGAVLYHMYVPVFLPDIWIWSTLESCPMHMAPYPPNNSIDGTTGLMTPDLSITKVVANRAVHVRVTNKDDRITEFQLPDWNDFELWNLGLWVEWSLIIGQPVTAVYRDGGVVPNLPVARIFSPTIINPDLSTFGTNRRYGTAFDGSRLIYPLTDDDGNNIFYVVSNADSEVLSNIIVGQQKAFLNAWLLKHSIPVSTLKSGIIASSQSKQRSRARALRAAVGGDPPGDMAMVAAVEAAAAEAFKPVNKVGAVVVELGSLIQGVGGTVQQPGTAAPPVVS
jgi:hypothetical protein